MTFQLLICKISLEFLQILLEIGLAFCRAEVQFQKQLMTFFGEGKLQEQNHSSVLCAVSLEFLQNLRLSMLTCLEAWVQFKYVLGRTLLC